MDCTKVSYHNTQYKLALKHEFADQVFVVDTLAEVLEQIAERSSLNSKRLLVYQSTSEMFSNYHFSHQLFNVTSYS